MAFESSQEEHAQKNLGHAVNECAKKTDSLHNFVSTGNWGDFDRIVFANALEKSISGLEEIQKILLKIREGTEKNGFHSAPDCSEAITDFEKTLIVLKRNLELEQAKKSRAQEVNILHKDSNPELYASLQHKILSLLLKTRYLNERLSIFARKQNSSPLPEKSTGKQIMELLEKKEEELQDLREKYSSIRRKSHLGLLEEKTSIDLETDILGFEKTIAANNSVFEQNIANAARQLEQIQSSFLAAKERFAGIKEILDNYSAKSSELLKILKKERDYAKKILLDVENETMQLRGSYTRELLNLEEAKLAAKKEAEEKLGKRIRVLQKELFETQDLLKRFKNIAEEKMAKEKKLEEEVKKMRLLLKVKERHDAVKMNFKK
ncbi:MAG: hypothetical protein PHH08_01675, partial [Candidatus ainarchaeum sp.]|nr:hypothetical protein [Candidatus ainarchaeum sp.]